VWLKRVECLLSDHKALKIQIPVPTGKKKKDKEILSFTVQIPLILLHPKHK
jgi:hypothetical protein